MIGDFRPIRLSQNGDKKGPSDIGFVFECTIYRGKNSRSYGRVCYIDACESQTEQEQFNQTID
jgi:hypothetical protein